MIDIDLPFPTLLTRAEVAVLLRCRIGFLTSAAITRAGPAFFKIGRHVRYDVADVRTWLDEHGTK